MPTLDPSQYFLPYQVEWLRDRSRLKISEKSRRVGMTYTQSYEDVRDAARANGAMDVWFSSADITAAREYIRYCAQWARILDLGARDLGETALASDQDIRVYAIEFSSGKRVTALSSNPDQFRSKGGKVVLDELAKHKDAKALWDAAQPTMALGYPMRLISTHRGKQGVYYQKVEEARNPGSLWSLHTTTIHDAVRQGLADRVLQKDIPPSQRRELTPAERSAWVADLRAICGDEDAWRQEYCCEPIDSATAWLPWDLIDAAQHVDAGEPARYGGGWCYVGWDVARRRDKTVFWVVETVGDIYWTREVVTLDKAPFAQQLDELAAITGRYRVSRICIDQMGMGEPVVESAQDRFGKLRAEGVQLTNQTKQFLSTTVKQRMEARQLRIPGTDAIRDSLHAVRRELTAANNYRFEADRTAAGHADEYWALALALHAAGDPSPAMEHKAWGDRWSASPDGLAGFANTSPNYRASNSIFDWS